MNRRRTLAIGICAALLLGARQAATAMVATEEVATGYFEAWKRLSASDVEGAAALLRPWCEAHPDDWNAWLALGYCEALSGAWSDAVRALTRARHGAGEVSQRASFDLARVLFEKARAAGIPGSPGAGAPTAGEVADARTRLSLLRLELETARDVLIDLIAASPPDVEARQALAAASELLRDVVARDTQWKSKATPPGPSSRGDGRPAPGALQKGPSGAKSSSGAKSRRPGENGGGAEGAAPGAGSTSSSASIGAAPLRPDEEVSLAQALRRALDERRRSDERKADARARLRGAQAQ